MEVYKILDEDNRLLAFEIDCNLISIGKMVELLRADPIITDIRKRQLFSAEEELRLAFNINGVPFIIAEPFGDNSRFWVGPLGNLNADNEHLVKKIEKHFLDYQPPILRRILGKILRGGTARKSRKWNSG